MRIFLIFTCMNILHTITAKQEISPAVRKLQQSCKDSGTCPVTLPKEELKKQLSPLQFHVTQEKGTERPFSGKYVRWKEEGVYTCIVCDNQLFSSDTKFNSGCGWPSFSDVIEKGHVTFSEDTTHGMNRIEVTCSKCGAHLGHFFVDDESPAGVRYCINSAALDFQSMQRMEVKCADCNSHLGHVFDDGPKVSPIRYCVNSTSLDFKKHTTV